MKKLSKHRIIVEDPNSKSEDKLDFDIDIYINSEGQFSTTLNAEIVSKLEDLGMSLRSNRINNKGFFIQNTKAGLIKEVSDFTREAFSRELVSSRILISYIVAFQCSYSKDINGNIVPNCSYEFGGKSWLGGKVESHATNPIPYGLQVYVKPVISDDYQYLSGKTVNKRYGLPYNGTKDYCLENNPNLFWLNSLASMSAPRFNGNGQSPEIKYMDYTEEKALFFVNLIKSICQMNEKFKHLFSEDNLELFINSQQSQNLLSL